MTVKKTASYRWIIGPACAGFLAEQSGTFSTSFLLAAVLAGTGMGLSLLLPGKRQPIGGQGKG